MVERGDVMFIILLKFSKNRDRASDYMDAHKKWLKQGFDDGVFFMAGSINPQLGGAILAKNISHETIVARVQLDPFVVENIVDAEVLEINPSRMSERFSHFFES
jgi:uncharacterized protein YciI